MTETPFYNMTGAQREIMELIVSSIDARGMSPTLQELADATKRTPQNVRKTLIRLEERGFITREKHAHRGITLKERNHE